MDDDDLINPVGSAAERESNQELEASESQLRI